MGSREGALKAQALKAAKLAARDSARTEEAGQTKVVLTGVDWLELFSLVEPKPALVKTLRELKQRSAELADDGSAERAKWTSAAGIEFEVLGYQTKTKELLLKSDVMDVDLKPDAHGKAPRVYVRVTNRTLWDAGFEGAGDLVLELLREVNGDEDPQVSRVDLCVDFMGWALTQTSLDNVTGRVRRRSTVEEPMHNKTHYVGRKLTGYDFGGGRLKARWYDKTEELKSSGKLWFKPLWRENGWVDEETSGPVCRLEYQIRRDPLKRATVEIDNVESNVSSWSQLKAALDPFWQYLTTWWLSYRLPRTAREKVRIHPRWAVLQAAHFVSAPRGELHRHRLDYSLVKTTGQAAGYTVRLFADFWEHEGMAPYALGTVDDYAKLLARMDAHYKEKHDGTTMFEAAKERHRQRAFLKVLLCGEKRHTREAAHAGPEA